VITLTRINMTMTDLTEFCYSHTDLKPLYTHITRVKKMNVLVLNKCGRAEIIGDPATMAEIKFDHYLVPVFHVACLASVTYAFTCKITARCIRMIALVHSS
jgi:hypothetical protein